MENVKVRAILATEGDYSHVVLDRATFEAVNGFRPALPYTTTRNAQGQGVRVFTIDGVTVYSRKDKDTKKSVFVMKTADAQRLLSTLADERANEPSLAFSF